MVADDRSLGDRDDVSSPPAPWRRLPWPWTPSGGAAVRVVAEGEQRRDVAVGDEPDVAAVAAVASVGAALGHVRLPAERDAARAAVTALDVQMCISSTKPATQPGYVAYFTSRTGSPAIDASHVVVSLACEAAPPVYDIWILNQQPVADATLQL